MLLVGHDFKRRTYFQFREETAVPERQINNETEILNETIVFECAPRIERSKCSTLWAPI
jgi:hypothetical protein